MNAQTAIGTQNTTVAPITTAPQTGPLNQASAEEATGASGAVKAPQTLTAAKAGLPQTALSTKSVEPQPGSNQAATESRSLPATTASDRKAAPAAKAAPSALMTAAIRTREGHEAVAKTQEAEIATATAKLAELRQLVAEGLIARVELENAEHLLAGLRNNLETLRKNAADSERTIAELRKAEELAKVKPLLPATNNSTRSFLKPVILRYGGQAGWSLGRLGMVQTFFASTFGQTLPVSALGQSATHNRLGYNHRNSVDVALHPDSVQGKALISYLESQGIPYLAFRTAVAGVATGPHIHIGYPSNRT